MNKMRIYVEMPRLEIHLLLNHLKEDSLLRHGLLDAIDNDGDLWLAFMAVIVANFGITISRNEAKQLLYASIFSHNAKPIEGIMGSQFEAYKNWWISQFKNIEAHTKDRKSLNLLMTRLWMDAALTFRAGSINSVTVERFEISLNVSVGDKDPMRRIKGVKRRLKTFYDERLKSDGLSFLPYIIKVEEI